MFKQQKQIIADYVSKNPNQSAKQVSAELGLNYNSVRGRISELKKSKVLVIGDLMLDQYINFLSFSEQVYS